MLSSPCDLRTWVRLPRAGGERTREQSRQRPFPKGIFRTHSREAVVPAPVLVQGRTHSHGLRSPIPDLSPARPHLRACPGNHRPAQHMVESRASESTTLWPKCPSCDRPKDLTSLLDHILHGVGKKMEAQRGEGSRPRSHRNLGARTEISLATQSQSHPTNVFRGQTDRPHAMSRENITGIQQVPSQGEK